MNLRLAGRAEFTDRERQNHARRVLDQSPDRFQVAALRIELGDQLSTLGRRGRWERGPDREQDHDKSDEGRNGPDYVHDRHSVGVLEISRMVLVRSYGQREFTRKNNVKKSYLSISLTTLS